MKPKSQQITLMEVTKKEGVVIMNPYQKHPANMKPNKKETAVMEDAVMEDDKVVAMHMIQDMYQETNMTTKREAMQIEVERIKAKWMAAEYAEIEIIEKRKIEIHVEEELTEVEQAEAE